MRIRLRPIQNFFQGAMLLVGLVLTALVSAVLTMQFAIHGHEVRVPVLKELLCAEGAPLCKLVGTDLFLLQQVGIDAQLANAVTVPEGFGDTTLNVPRPNGTLYLKLRDDPSVVNTAVLPVTPEPSQSAAVAPPADPAKAASAAQPETKQAQQTAPAATTPPNQ